MSLAARARAASTERRAVFAVIGAVVLWSASSWFVRAGESDALVFTTYRLWFALPPLAVGAYLRARHHPERRLVPPGVDRGHWLLVMFGAGAFFVGGASTAFAALGMTRLLDVTLIGALSPIIVIAFAVAFLGEHVHRGLIVRAAIAIVGHDHRRGCGVERRFVERGGRRDGDSQPRVELRLVSLRTHRAHPLRDRSDRVHVRIAACARRSSSRP